jgi:hypothetical protein
VGTRTSGAAKSSGTTYALPQTGFPWIQFDKSAHKIVLHAGSEGASQLTASAGFSVSKDGAYTIGGDYQRVDTYAGPLEVVDAAVILDSDSAHPLWTDHLASNNPSKTIFSVRKALRRGQVVRFVVFGGTGGRTASVI